MVKYNGVNPTEGGHSLEFSTHLYLSPGIFSFILNVEPQLEVKRESSPYVSDLDIS